MDALNERIAKAVKRNAGSTSPEESSRAVVREVLLWEFGQEFRDHPEFAAIVDRVAEAVADNPRLSRDIAAVLSHLK